MNTTRLPSHRVPGLTRDLAFDRSQMSRVKPGTGDA